MAGLARAPKKISKTFSKKKIALRSKVKPFVKLVNYNHIMPTRSVHTPALQPHSLLLHCFIARHFSHSRRSYSLDVELSKDVVSKTAIKKPVRDSSECVAW